MRCYVGAEACMSEQLTLEERHRLLKEVLRENSERKRFIEMNVGEQFEGFKKLEISLEKMRASREIDRSLAQLSV